jgi:hypothetical protein
MPPVGAGSNKFTASSSNQKEKAMSQKQSPTKPKRVFNHGDYKARLRTAYERLGTTSPKCAVCDETDPFCLELDHIGGRANADETWILCRNHHAKMSNARRDHPISGNNLEHPANRLGHIVLGIVELLSLIADMLREAGLYLIAIARSVAPAPTVGDAQ